MVDIAIIGVGVIGAVTARELSKYKLRVCLLERGSDVCMGSSKANSAIVHAGFDAEPGTLKARLNVLGSELMEPLCAELGVSYKRTGALVIGFPGDEEMIAALLKRGTENGVRGLKILSGDETRAIAPNCSSAVVSALYAPTSAITCPYGLTIAAAGNAMDNGAELRLNFEVDTVERLADCYELRSGNQCVHARFVINAAGMYSDAVSRMIGDGSFSITPRRGEYILLDRECCGLVRHTIFKTPSAMGKGILISPTADGVTILGPTSHNIDDKEDAATTAPGLEEVTAGVKKSVPSVPLNKAITSFSGLRAVGPTGDFIINVPKPGFVNAAAIDSPGLSAAPAIAKYIIELLIKEGLAAEEKPDFEPFRRAMHWYKELSDEQKNAVIKEDPSYGHIVCRCETVSEGEIRDAIRENPPAYTVDAVKRRTRSGMGRCQGGFCAPSVMEILSRETGVPYNRITKSGGESEMLFGRTKGGDEQ
jgi:glycerol-3-phosphate dehydrogenase